MKNKATLVYGVGVNDADYEVTRHELIGGKRIQTWICPYYIRWASMIQRCYHQLCQLRHPTYVGCSVVEEWHRFGAFKAWMEIQDWAGKDLDKDLLLAGNRIYGPEYCCFITRQVNCIVREASRADGELPIGVAFYEKRRKFRGRANCALTGKRKHLGYFDTAQAAHGAWLGFMRNQARALAAQQTDRRAANALINLYQDTGAQNA